MKQQRPPAVVRNVNDSMKANRIPVRRRHLKLLFFFGSDHESHSDKIISCFTILRTMKRFSANPITRCDKTLFRFSARCW